jgi:hypothetical protein
MQLTEKQRVALICNGLHNTTRQHTPDWRQRMKCVDAIEIHGKSLEEAAALIGKDLEWINQFEALGSVWAVDFFTNYDIRIIMLDYNDLIGARATKQAVDALALRFPESQILVDGDEIFCYTKTNISCTLKKLPEFRGVDL